MDCSESYQEAAATNDSTAVECPTPTRQMTSEITTRSAATENDNAAVVTNEIEVELQEELTEDTGLRGDVTDDANDTTKSQIRSHADFAFECDQRLLECIAFVMENVTYDTISVSSKVFLDVIAEVDDRVRLNCSRITGYIVQTVIDEPSKIDVYANLCAEVYRKASSEDSRDSVRNAFPFVFKLELLWSCIQILMSAGVLNYSRFAGDGGFQVRLDPGADRSDRRNPKIADENTLITCRFMGLLFVTDAFEITKVITRTVNALLKAQDDRSLECLCVLMTVIGPEFERVSTANETYERLEQVAISGYANDFLAERTVQMINELVDLRNRNWTGGRHDSLSDDLIEKYQNLFTHNLEQESQYCESVGRQRWNIYTVTCIPDEFKFDEELTTNENNI